MFAQRVWGIDLGRSAVKGVLLTPAEDGVEVLDADVIPFEGSPPDPSQDPTRDGRLWKALRKFQEKHQLHGAAICVAIPAQNTLVRELTIARVGRRKLEEMVRFEASNEIPFVLDEVVWDYTLFDEAPDEPTRQGLLLAVKKNVIQTYLRVLAQLEMTHVDLITLAPLALLNLVRLEQGDGARALALDVGAENTNMLAVEDGRFWLRNMLTGGNRITVLLQEEFDLEFEEAQRAKENIGRSRYAKQILAAVGPAVHELLRNVKTNLTYLGRDRGAKGFETTYLTGGGAKLPGVREQLTNTLRLQVQDMAELQHVAVSPEADVEFIRANLDRLVVAIGAGLSGLDKDVAGVSFLPKGEARVAQISRSKGLVFAVGVCLWAIMLTLYGFGLKVQKAIVEPLHDYRELATITIAKDQELDAARDTGAEEEALQEVLHAARGKNQIFRILDDVVWSFSAANRASRHRFQILTLRCTDVERDRAVRAARRQDTPTETPHSPAEPDLAEEFCWTTGYVKGRILAPRGSRPGEAYRRLIEDLVDGLRNRPALAKASGRATFQKGRRGVSAEAGDWSELVRSGDLIRALPDGEWAVVAEAVSATELNLTDPWAADDFVGDYVLAQVALVQFNERALEFTVRFQTPRAEPTRLDGLLPSEYP